MKTAICIAMILALSGCGTVVPMVAGWQSDSAQARAAAAKVRLQLFCNMSFAAAIELYPDPADYERARELCKPKAAP